MNKSKYPRLNVDMQMANAFRKHESPDTLYIYMVKRQNEPKEKQDIYTYNIKLCVFL